MTSVKIAAHIDKEGILKVQVPTDMKEEDVEVVLVYEKKKDSKESEQKRLSLKDLYGSTKDSPLIEPEELPYDNREEVI